MTDTFEGTPNWYGGNEGLKAAALRKIQQTTGEAYRPYPANLRNAAFSPLQNLSFDQSQTEATNPVYSDIFQQSTGAVRDALGRNILPTLQPYLTSATENPTTNAREYMNPYNDQVINNIGVLASRNLHENILPGVNDKFIRAGSYGSSGGMGSHQDVTGKAIRDTQEAVTRAQSEALQSGYNKALETSVGQQARNIQAGELAGNVGIKDIERQFEGAKGLQAISGAQQQDRRAALGNINQLGTQQQQNEQTALNTQYADFLRQQEHPYIQAARLNEAVGNQPLNQYTANAGFMPQAPQASPWTQGAGLLAGITGAANQRTGFAHGGPVHKKPSIAHLRHYADGGSVTMSPIQKGVNDAFDTAEIQAMRNQAHKLQNSQVDPFWSAISRAGFDVASNRQPGVLAALGQAGKVGLDEYSGQLANQDKRGIEASKIHELIDNTRRTEQERNRSHAFAQSKFDFAKDMEKKRFGLEQEKHTATLEKYGRDKEKENIITGKDGILYELTKDSDGNRVVKPIEGMKGKNDIYKKDNEKAIGEARSSLGALDSLNYNINALEKVASRLDTGQFKGRVSKYATSVGDLPLWLGGGLAAGASEDVNEFESITNQLVLDLGNQLKGSQIALGKLRIIEKTKPELEKTREGNLQIISHLRDLATLAKEKNNFIIENVENGANAVKAQKAFSEYADAKLDFEEKNPGQKFPNKPEDFMELSELEGKSSKGNNGSSIESMSELELKKIAGE